MTVRTETAGGSFDTDTGSDALHSGLFKAQTDEPKLVVLHIVPVEAVMPATVSATDLLPEHSRRNLELQQLQAALYTRVCPDGDDSSDAAVTTGILPPESQI